MVEDGEAPAPRARSATPRAHARQAVVRWATTCATSLSWTPMQRTAACPARPTALGVHISCSGNKPFTALFSFDDSIRDMGGRSAGLEPRFATAAAP